MKYPAIVLSMLLFVVSCTPNQVIIDAAEQGTEQIRREHLQWTYELARPPGERELPEFDEVDVMLRERLHEEFTDFIRQAREDVK